MPLTSPDREPAGDSDSSLLYQGNAEASYLRRVALKAASSPPPAKFTVSLRIVRQGMASPRPAGALLTRSGREAMISTRRGEATALFVLPDLCYLLVQQELSTLLRYDFCSCGHYSLRVHAKQQQHAGVKCLVPTGVHEATNQIR